MRQPQRSRSRIDLQDSGARVANERRRSDRGHSRATKQYGCAGRSQKLDAPPHPNNDQQRERTTSDGSCRQPSVLDRAGKPLIAMDEQQIGWTRETSAGARIEKRRGNDTEHEPGSDERRAAYERVRHETTNPRKRQRRGAGQRARHRTRSQRDSEQQRARGPRQWQLLEEHRDPSEDQQNCGTPPRPLPHQVRPRGRNAQARKKLQRHRPRRPASERLSRTARRADERHRSNRRDHRRGERESCPANLPHGTDRDLVDPRSPARSGYAPTCGRHIPVTAPMTRPARH